MVLHTTVLCALAKKNKGSTVGLLLLGTSQTDEWKVFPSFIGYGTAGSAADGVTLRTDTVRSTLSYQ
jgi:hypothetical protein